MDQYAGVYRGVIEATNDPEKRKRYRVRVFMLHPEAVPVEALPWAETSMFVGKTFGDFVGYEEGDRVFVMFEGGDRRFPVIMGGFMSQSSGIPDAPSEVRADYAITQQRWLRLDRIGNKIEMSPLAEERWIKLQSGEAQVNLRMNDGTVEILSNTQVTVTAPQVAVAAEEQVSVNTPIYSAQLSDFGTCIATNELNFQAGSRINVGRYEDPILGPLKQRTTGGVYVEATSRIDLTAGTVVPSSLGDVNVTATRDVITNATQDVYTHADGAATLDAVAKLTISCDADIEVIAGGKVLVDATGEVEVTTQGKVIVDAASSIEVTAAQGITIEATAQNITINANAGNINMEAQGQLNLTAGAAGTYETTGPLTLKSNSSIKIEAPTVDVTANAVLKMEGGATASLNAGLISIG